MWDVDVDWGIELYYGSICTRILATSSPEHIFMNSQSIWLLPKYSVKVGRKWINIIIHFCVLYSMLITGNSNAWTRAKLHKVRTAQLQGGKMLSLWKHIPSELLCLCSHTCKWSLSLPCCSHEPVCRDQSQNKNKLICKMKICGELVLGCTNVSALNGTLLHQLCSMAVQNT